MGQNDETNHTASLVRQGSPGGRAVLLLGLPELEDHRRYKDAIPHVEERVSYGTAAMFSLGRDLVGFVSQPKHLSFFMASPTLARAMKSEITN